MTTSPDDRSPKAVAYQWATRIMTISFEMVVPGLLGYWLDSRVGTMPLLTVMGFALGMVLGIWHLLRMTAVKTDGSGKSSNRR